MAVSSKDNMSTENLKESVVFSGPTESFTRASGFLVCVMVLECGKVLRVTAMLDSGDAEKLTALEFTPGSLETDTKASSGKT